MKARIRHLEFEPGRRILAVSDVHGNLPYLRGLLDRVRFDARDYLVFVGDIIEKGPQSLETLRFTNPKAVYEIKYLPADSTINWVSRDTAWLIEHKEEMLEKWNALYTEIR